MAENYFEVLYNLDLSEDQKEKNGLLYLPWATAWGEVKKKFPDATYTIYKQPIKITQTKEDTVYERDVLRPWFDDGKTGWVSTGVTINGIEHIEELAIMDFKNKSIPADSIASTDAVKSIQRSLTKACARHGVALNIYKGEEFPENVKKAKKEQAEKEQKKKEEQDKELKKQKDALLELMGTLIEDGAEKDDIYAIISKHNDGKKNPSSIQNIELCAKIIAEINKKYKEKK